MAGDWMKVELTLPDKPEVHYIAGMLNMDPDAVIGKLMRVWRWFNENTVDGKAIGVTFSLIDRITMTAGFGEAMQFAGWLVQESKLLVMPAFDRHTSKSAKRRAEDMLRKVKPPKDSATNAESLRNDCGKSAESLRDETRGGPIINGGGTETPSFVEDAYSSQSEKQPNKSGDTLDSAKIPEGLRKVCGKSADEMRTRERERERINTPLPPKGEDGTVIQAPQETPTPGELTAAAVAAEFWNQIPGRRRPMLEDVTAEFAEKVRLHGQGVLPRLLRLVKSPTRDKTQKLWQFWKDAGLGGDPGPAAAPLRLSHTNEEILSIIRPGEAS
jgi:hypothetical protein